MLRSPVKLDRSEQVPSRNPNDLAHPAQALDGNWALEFGFGFLNAKLAVLEPHTEVFSGMHSL